MKVNDILEYIETFSPLKYAESFDNVGLLVGDGDTEIEGIACSLDITNMVIEDAAANGANLIISHHPVIFDPLKKIPEWSPVYSLIKHGMCAVCIHTNFDITEGGVNEALLELLGFERSFVLEETQPNGLGFGAVCDFPLGFTPKGLAEHCKQSLFLDSVKYGRHGGNIRRAAVCCGGGVNSTVMELARKAKCDAIISGDIKHNFWIEAENCGMTLIDAGHYGTEKCAPHRIAALISRKFGQIPVFSVDSEEEPCCYV
jgi:dinuclear metal center YbgI/SA1388 family protein